MTIIRDTIVLGTQFRRIEENTSAKPSTVFLQTHTLQSSITEIVWKDLIIPKLKL
jgi:hypothetical protein